MVHKVVVALQVLTNKFGFFRISPKMIGYTKSGEVKVWINSNFALNWPEYDVVNKNERVGHEKL